MVLWNQLHPKEGAEAKEIELENVGVDTKKSAVNPVELFIEREKSLNKKSSSEIYAMYGKMMEALENLDKINIDMRIIIEPYLLREKFCMGDIPMNKAASFIALALSKGAAPGSYFEVFAFEESNPVKINETDFSSIAASIKPSNMPTTSESITKLIKDCSLDMVVVIGHSLELNHLELVRNKKFLKLVVCSLDETAVPESGDSDVLFCSGFDKNLCNRIMSFAA